MKVALMKKEKKSVDKLLDKYLRNFSLRVDGFYHVSNLKLASSYSNFQIRELIPEIHLLVFNSMSVFQQLSRH
jgi:hypothetical protein